jgi:glyoxylase-like metal-dependent hydrolase (beta-lactamase superfamily II)
MEEQLQKIADGIYMAGPFSEWNVGGWILVSGNECALLEMPPPDPGQANPAFRIRRLLKDRGWECRYLLFSHPHWDHTASLAEYRKAFPEAKFLAHYSAPLFFKMSEYYWTKGYLVPQASPWDNVKEQCGRAWYIQNFDLIWHEDTHELSLNGEPLYGIYGPKHSLGDIHYIFKGVIFTGDWWLYEGDPCQDPAASSKAQESIKRIEAFLKEKNYHVHSAYPAHGDNLFHHIDINEALTRTLAYHRDYEIKNPQNLEWKDFRIRNLYDHFFPLMTKDLNI